MLELLDISFGRKGYPKTVEYTESDFPDRWEKQWRRKGAYESSYYTAQTNKDIGYNLNSQGYREKEWNNINWNQSILCLGCSHTFGVGVPKDETMPHKLSKKLQVNCVNLGIPGGSNFFSAINSSKLINSNIKPLAVVFQKTYRNRWFSIKNNTLDCITGTDLNITNFFPTEEYSQFVDSNISNIIESQWKNISPVFAVDMEMFNDRDNLEYIARDGAHWNGLYFEKIVDVLSKNIINTISIKET